MRAWLTKLRLTIRYHLEKAVEIQPFLQINPNAYCPACGHRNGKIESYLLTKEDQSKSIVAVAHHCNVCAFEWPEHTVSIVTPGKHLLDVPETEEQTLEREMKTDRRTKQVKTRVMVNGEVVR